MPHTAFQTFSTYWRPSRKMANEEKLICENPLKRICQSKGDENHIQNVLNDEKTDLEYLQLIIEFLFRYYMTFV